ncbi:MAG: HAMP domain-containing histidine kinase, partial [Bacteroidetes bacterium]|nr:HAMP domain-containing histidine kinase [Bacteroidota bacterium]
MNNTLLLIVITYFIPFTFKVQAQISSNKSIKESNLNYVLVDKHINNLRDFYQIDEKKALNEVHEAEKLALQDKNFDLQIYALSKAAFVFYELNNLHHALTYISKALNIEIAHTEEISVDTKVRLLNSSIFIYFKSNSSVSIANDLIKKLEILLVNNKNNTNFGFYASHLGNSYYLVRDLENAKKWTEKAFSSLKSQDSLSYISTGIQLAFIYSENNETKKALELMDSLSDRMDNSSNELLVNFYGNYAQLLFMNNEPEKAIEMFKSIYSKLNNSSLDKFHKHNLAFRIAQIYFYSSNYKDALEWALDSYEYSKKYGISTKYYELLKLLQQIYLNRSNYKKAYTYLEEELVLKDSLNELRLKDELFKLKSELDSSLVMAEYNALVKVQEYERYILYVFILFSIILITLFGILFRANKKTKYLNVILADQHIMISEQNEKLENAVRTKNRIFSIIGHDLRGPISTMYSYLDIISDEDTDVNLLDSIKEQLRIAMETSMNLLDNLVFWGQTQQEEIKPTINKTNLNELLDEILLQQAIYAASK